MPNLHNSHFGQNINLLMKSQSQKYRLMLILIKNNKTHFFALCNRGEEQAAKFAINISLSLLVRTLYSIVCVIKWPLISSADCVISAWLINLHTVWKRYTFAMFHVLWLFFWSYIKCTFLFTL